MVEARSPTTHSDWPRVILLINEDYCAPKWDYIERAGQTECCQTVKQCQTLNVETLSQSYQTLNVDCVIADPVHFGCHKRKA